MVDLGAPSQSRSPFPPRHVANDQRNRMSGYSIFVGQFGLLATIADPACSDFPCTSLSHLHTPLIAAKAKGICALRNAVSAILRLIAKRKVEGIHAIPAVSSWTFMQDHLALWDRSMEQDPAYQVRGDYRCSQASCDASIDIAVSMMQTRLPNPTAIGIKTLDFIEEPFQNRCRKFLRGEVGGVSVGLWDVCNHASCRLRAVTGRAGALLNSSEMIGASQSLVGVSCVRGLRR